MPDISDPVHPLRLSNNEAQARTLIAQRAIDLPLRQGALTWEVRLQPVVATEPFSEACYRATFEWSGASVVLTLPATVLEQSMSAALNGAELPPIPGELAQAVLEAGLREVLESLQGLGRGIPHLTALDPVSAPSSASSLPLHAFELSVRNSSGPETWNGTLHADALGLLLIAGLLARRPPRPGPLDDSLPIELRAELGVSSLARSEVHSLEPGDVILVDTPFLDGNRTLWLTADGRSGLYAQVSTPQTSPPCLTVTHIWTQNMAESHDAAPDYGADAEDDLDASDGTVTFDTLPVRLSFDLGEISLSLADLQQLQPGQAISLGHPLAGAVRIRANQALIGEGDLVEINGKLGVSVRSLFGSQKK